MPNIDNRMSSVGYRMPIIFYSAVLMLALSALPGCVSTSRPLEVGRDTYSVSATADGMRDAASAKESAFEVGREKCAEEDKRFLLLSEETYPTRMGIDTTVDVTFRCVHEDDPEYARPKVRPTPDVVIEDKRP